MNNNTEEIKNEDSIIESITKERDEYLDGWKRAKADFINYKNEENDRLKRLGSITKEIILSDVLSVLDSFDLGIISVQDIDAKKGMELIRMQLEEVVKRHGLEKIQVVVGETFNPIFHEAIGEIETQEHEDGAIMEEVTKGYILDGKVIRPSRVKLSKKINKNNN